MNIDIFKVNKLGQKIFQIINPIIKNIYKKVSTEIETVYIHKNIQLIVNQNGNKRCYEVISKEGKTINDNYIVQYYLLNEITITSFPCLNNYDNQYERIIDKYICKDNEFMVIRENETLYFKIKDNINLDKFIKEIS